MNVTDNTHLNQATDEAETALEKYLKEIKNIAIKYELDIKCFILSTLKASFAITLVPGGLETLMYMINESEKKESKDERQQQETSSAKAKVFSCTSN